jgi:hypothetical protein
MQKLWVFLTNSTGVEFLRRDIFDNKLLLGPDTARGFVLDYDLSLV